MVRPHSPLLVAFGEGCEPVTAVLASRLTRGRQTSLGASFHMSGGGRHGPRRPQIGRHIER